MKPQLLSSLKPSLQTATKFQKCLLLLLHLAQLFSNSGVIGYHIRDFVLQVDGAAVSLEEFFSGLLTGRLSRRDFVVVAAWGVAETVIGRSTNNALDVTSMRCDPDGCASDKHARAPS